MKKLILTTAIVIGLATTAFSQASQVFQPDTVVLLYDHSYFEVGETMKFVMSYDTDGILSQCEQYYSEQPYKNIDLKAEAYLRLPIQLRTVYEYDPSLNVVKMTEQYFAPPRPPRYIRDYVYEDGKRIMYVRHYDGIEVYYCVDSVLYQYDIEGRPLHETVYRMNNQLILSKEIDYSYGNSVVEKTTNGLSLYGIAGDWVTLERKTQTYGDDETLLTVETESYENPTTLETYSYDGEGRITNILTQTLSDDNKWVNSKLLEYTYDGEGHLILAEIKSWQEGEFVHAHRAVYELNEAGYPAVIDFEKWNGEEWVQGTWKAGFYIFKEPYLSRQNAFLCRTDAKHIEISYTNTELPAYDVEEHTTTGDAVVTIYPNPANSIVTITGKNLKSAEVLNVLGQSVATVKGQGETLQIDMANLPTGVYFVNITDEEGRKCVRKVVKE